MITIIGITMAFSLLLGFSTYNRNKVWRSTIEFWQNIIKNAPGKARAYNNYGVHISDEQGRYEEAIAYFKKAIQMDKNYPDPHNNIAICYSHCKKLNLAIKHLQHSISINPNAPEPYNNLASFYIDLKRYNDAMQALKQAIKLRTHYGKAYYNMGRIFMKENNLENACECFENSCTKADFDNIHGFRAFAFTSFQLKHFDKAIKAYQKVLELSPTDREAIINLGSSYFYNQDYTNAIKTFENLTKMYPNDLTAYTNLAEVFFHNGNYEKSLELFKKIVSNAPQTKYYIRMAECLEGLGRPEDAIKMLDSLKDKTLPYEAHQKVNNLLKRIKEQYA